MEILEPRRLFAGTVTISTTGPEILITGDGADNQLGISALGDGFGGISAAGVYSVNAGSGRLFVDGREASFNRSFQSPPASAADAWNAKPFRIRLGNGDDTLTVSNAHFAALTVDAGDGKDVVNVALISQNEFGGSANDVPTAGLRIDGGSGDDRIMLQRGLAARYGNVSIFPGFGRDRISMLGEPGTPARELRLIVQGRLEIQDTQGPLSLSMRYIDVGKQTSIITGNSIDRVTFDHCSFARPIVIGTHGGNDVVTNVASRFRAGGILAPGTGDDTLVDVGELIAR